MMRLNRVLLFPLLVLYLHSGPLAGQGLVNEPDSTPLAVVPEDTATDSFRKALDPVLAAQVVELVNQQRLNNGNLPPLKIDTLAHRRGRGTFPGHGGAGFLFPLRSGYRHRLQRPGHRGRV